MRLPASLKKALVELFSEGSEEVQRAERLMAPIAPDDLEGGYRALAAIRQNMSEIVGWKTLNNQEVPQSALDESDMNHLRRYLADNGVDMSPEARNARAAEQGYGEEVFARGVGSPSSQYYGMNNTLDHFDGGELPEGPSNVIHASPVDQPWQYQSYSGVGDTRPIDPAIVMEPDFNEMWDIRQLDRPYNIFIRAREMPSRMIDGQGRSISDVGLPWEFNEPFIARGVRDGGGNDYRMAESQYPWYTADGGDSKPGSLEDGFYGDQYGFDTRHVRDVNAMYLPQFVGRRGLLLGLGGATIAPYALGTPYGTQE